MALLRLSSVQPGHVILKDEEVVVFLIGELCNLKLKLLDRVILEEAKN